MFSFPFVGVVQPTVWQGTMSTTKEQKRTITLRQLTTTAILFSCFPFVGVVQPTVWQGTTSTTKGQKRTNRLQQLTITAILLFPFPFVGIIQSAVWQGTTSTTKGQKRTITLRQWKTTAIPERQSTTTIRHCQENGITNCVLFLLNWSKCIPRRNGIEYIPHCRCKMRVSLKGKMQTHFTMHFTVESNPRINLGLECRND